MPTNVEAVTGKPRSLLVSFVIAAGVFAPTYLLVSSGDSARARRVIDTNDDGILSLEEEGYAKRLVAGIPRPYDERLEQAVALKKAIIQMREEREKPKSDKKNKVHHYTELF